MQYESAAATHGYSPEVNSNVQFATHVHSKFGAQLQYVKTVKESMHLATAQVIENIKKYMWWRHGNCKHENP